MIEIPDDTLAAEPWLAGYRRASDTSLEDVRRRARRATTGELHRRSRHREEPLLVRQVGPDGLMSTAVQAARDEISTRPVPRP